MKKFFLNDPNLLVYGFVMVFFASFGQTFYIALFNDDIRNLYKITDGEFGFCLLYTSPSPRDRTRSRMPSSA